MNLIPTYKFKEFCKSKVYLDWCDKKLKCGENLKFNEITELYSKWILSLIRDEKLKSLGI